MKKPFLVLGVVILPALVSLGQSQGNTARSSENDAAAQVVTANNELRAVRRVSPVYPPSALSARIQGSVVLGVAVDLDGNVTCVKGISGDPILIRAAIAAVKQWKYQWEAKPLESGSKTFTCETDSASLTQETKPQTPQKSACAIDANSLGCVAERAGNHSYGTVNYATADVPEFSRSVGRTIVKMDFTLPR